MYSSSWNAGNWMPAPKVQLHDVARDRREGWTTHLVGSIYRSHPVFPQPGTVKDFVEQSVLWNSAKAAYQVTVHRFWKEDLDGEWRMKLIDLAEPAGLDGVFAVTDQMVNKYRTRIEVASDGAAQLVIPARPELPTPYDSQRVKTNRRAS